MPDRAQQGARPESYVQHKPSSTLRPLSQIAPGQTSNGSLEVGVGAALMGRTCSTYGEDVTKVAMFWIVLNCCEPTDFG